MESLYLILISILVGFVFLLLPVVNDKWSPFVKRGGNKNLLNPIKLAIKKRKALYIVAGELHNEGWNDTQVKEKLIEANRFNIPIYVLCGPRCDPESTEFRSIARATDNIRVGVLSNWPKEHFRLVEDEKIWIEQYHPPGFPGPWRTIESTKKRVIKAAEKEFNQLEQKTKLVTI